MTAASRSGNPPEGLAGGSGGEAGAARVRAAQPDVTDEDSLRALQRQGAPDHVSDELLRVVVGSGGRLRGGSTSLGGLAADLAVKPSPIPASAPAVTGAAA